MQEIGYGGGEEAGTVDHPQGKLSGKDLEQLVDSRGGQVSGTKQRRQAAAVPKAEYPLFNFVHSCPCF